MHTSEDAHAVVRAAGSAIRTYWLCERRVSEAFRCLNRAIALSYNLLLCGDMIPGHSAQKESVPRLPVEYTPFPPRGHETTPECPPSCASYKQARFKPPVIKQIGNSTDDASAACLEPTVFFATIVAINRISTGTASRSSMIRSKETMNPGAASSSQCLIDASACFCMVSAERDQKK